jgi:hypothetical protein
MNKNSGHVYIEGSDYNSITDTKLNNSHGNYFPYHTPPTFSRIANGLLHNGDTARISYYHPFAAISDNTGNGSVMACVSEDTLYAILTDQVKRVNNLYQPSSFFMGHDEIRNMNHDAICLAKNESPATLLSSNITRCHDLIRATSPKSDILMWSDMVDSLHNAHNNYYLINGDLTGDWNTIPKDITIVNWNGGNESNSLNFFADHGFKQITSPYYDVGNTSTIRSWRLAQEGVSGVRGMMYTTWANDYRFVGPFAYYAWGAGPNIIHTPLDTSALSMVKIPFSAEVYPDPYDATDAITSVNVSIFDTSGSLLNTIKLDSMSASKYQALIPNSYQTGFLYAIQAYNKQGLIRRTPEYVVRKASIDTSDNIVKLTSPSPFVVPGVIECGGHYQVSVPLYAYSSKDSAVSIGPIIMTPSLGPFSFVSFGPETVPSGGYAFLNLHFDPVSGGCDTSYIRIIYNADSVLNLVLIGCCGVSNVPDAEMTSATVDVNPNPFKDETTLTLTNYSPSAKIILTDILGKSISLPYADKIVLDAKQLDLHEGMYVLRVDDNGTTISRNIIYLK